MFRKLIKLNISMKGFVATNRKKPTTLQVSREDARMSGKWSKIIEILCRDIQSPQNAKTRVEIEPNLLDSSP